MDTRTPSPSPVKRSNGSSGAQSENADETYNPDLSNEVAMLSTKLINAINYQTNLDDTLQATRHELERSRQELNRVKAEKQSLDDAIAQGVLVKKAEFDKTIAQLRADLAKEKASREIAEKAKRQTEGELQDLTSSLFEEANNMVAEARKDTEAVERRNSQLRSQLSDTEVILASQQEQLQDMKSTMERLERIETNARDSSVPSTPINSGTAAFDALQHSPSATGAQADLAPNQPLHFSQLIAPVLRTDTAAYTDFSELLSWARRATPHSRNASGNISQTNLSGTSNTAMAAATSSPNLPGAFSFGSSSAANSPSSSNFNSSSFIPPLKESKFYRRTLVEDLEPTLRLDLAPGLSFLSRRSVNSSLLSGALAIEPFTPTAKLYSPIFACALCGESRKQEPYVRKHRFRTSDSEDAQRYPLCEYCLGRLRAAADFVGFLRMVRDGLWRCGNEEEEKSAWEESVRLRERMLWARMGGGVVPAYLQQRGTTIEPGSATAVKSEPRRSLDSIPEDGANGEDEPGLGVGTGKKTSQAADDSTPSDSTGEDQEDAATKTRAELEKRVSRRLSLSPEQSPQAATSAISGAGSQQDQDDADLQLRREDSEAIAETMQTPPETPQVEAPTPVDKPDEPAPPSEPQQPLSGPLRTEQESPSSSSSSQRNLSPSKRPTAGMEERTSSNASSVLARVRAMEAKSTGPK